jgi:hypothetical protein
MPSIAARAPQQVRPAACGKGPGRSSRRCCSQTSNAAFGNSLLHVDAHRLTLAGAGGRPAIAETAAGEAICPSRSALRANQC